MYTCTYTLSVFLFSICTTTAVRVYHRVLFVYYVDWSSLLLVCIYVWKTTICVCIWIHVLLMYTCMYQKSVQSVLAPRKDVRESICMCGITHTSVSHICGHASDTNKSASILLLYANTFKCINAFNTLQRTTTTHYSTLHHAASMYWPMLWMLASVWVHNS